MAGRRSETGGSSISSILWLIALAAGAYAVWNVAPVYIDHYSFQDKVVEMARLPRAGNTDEQILTRLMREVRERQLTEYIQPASFGIQTRETGRRILLEYQREAKVLPGWKRIFKMSMDVDQPIPY